MRSIVNTLVLCFGCLLIECGKGEEKRELSDTEYRKKIEIAEKIRKIRRVIAEPKDSMAAFTDTTQTNDTTPYFADYNGYRYYFACGPCRDRFIIKKEKYLQECAGRGIRVGKRKL